jgi:hypothetical protein
MAAGRVSSPSKAALTMIRPMMVFCTRGCSIQVRTRWRLSPSGSVFMFDLMAISAT